jgi:hypothetical protein
LLTRLGLLLEVEPWGWQTASAGSPDWQFWLNRHVRRFRGVKDRDQYWSIRTRQTEQPSPRRVDTERESMGTADKIFISHASADRKLADLLRDMLVLGGIPRERIFYSSSRATGIPSGTDVRARESTPNLRPGRPPERRIADSIPIPVQRRPASAAATAEKSGVGVRWLHDSRTAPRIRSSGSAIAWSTWLGS